MSILSTNVKILLKDIAIDNHMKDFVVTYKEDEFTGANYLGTIGRVKMVDSITKHPLNLILKISPKDETLREKLPVAEYYKREIYAYKYILPALNKFQLNCHVPSEERFKFPVFYTAQERELKELLIFKDMSQEGYQHKNWRNSLDYYHVSMVLKNLAMFHATSFVLKKKDPECFAKLSEQAPHSMNYGKAIYNIITKTEKSLYEKLDSPTKKKFSIFCDDISKKLDDVLDACTSEPYNVICHGDCCINNLLFKYSEGQLSDVLFLDFQILRLASPVTDISYFIFLSTDHNLRQNHFKNLLNLYYGALIDYISKMGCDPEECYPRKVFEQHLKDYMIFGLILSLCAIPILLKKPGEETPLHKIVENFDDENSVTNLNEDAVARLRENISDFIEFVLT